MKKLFMLILLGHLGVCAIAQTTVRLPLQAVTLDFSGAELHHQGEISLPAGPAELHLLGLSPYADANSLQADVRGAELDAVERVAAAPVKPGTAPITLLDSLRAAQARSQALRTEELAIAAEKEFWQQNRQLGSVKPGRWVAETKQAAAYYSTRMGELSQRETQVKEAQAAQATLLAALSQRAGLSQAAAPPTEIVLRLQVPRAGTVRLGVSYRVQGRGEWAPKYELRVSESNLRQLSVLTRASVSNYTGVDWVNVPVALRNTTPTDGLEQPTLAPWGVSFGLSRGEGEGRLDNFAVKGSSKPGSAGAVPTVAEAEGRLRLPDAVTLPNSTFRTFRLAEQQLPMRLEYLAIPKKSESVFLVGKVADWNQVGFVGESAQVFFRGAYVGTAEIDTRAFADSLEISLGQDPALQLTRTKREDFVTRAAGREKTKLVYEINAKNTHSFPVRLRLLDQVPISQEKDIVVKVLDMGGATTDPASGKLTWNFTLAPGASRRLPVAFTVDAPDDVPTNLRRNRRVSAPKTR